VEEEKVKEALKLFVKECIRRKEGETCVFIKKLK